MCSRCCHSWLQGNPACSEKVRAVIKKVETLEAQGLGLPSLARDITLDELKSILHVNAQMEELAQGVETGMAEGWTSAQRYVMGVCL
jgi:hypothetical protein